MVFLYHWHRYAYELVTPPKSMLEIVPSKAPKSCCSHHGSWTGERGGGDAGAMLLALWKK